MTATPKEIRIENGVGTVIYQNTDTTITYDPTNDYTIISSTDTTGEIELPDISALNPYNGYPENLTQIPTPISDTEAKYRTEYGDETRPDNLEAQTLVASLVGLGYGSSPAGPFNGDGCTIYSHVDTEDGTDAEVRALIFRSTTEGTDPNISDRGAIACWASSTLLSSTATPLPVIDTKTLLHLPQRHRKTHPRARRPIQPPARHRHRPVASARLRSNPHCPRSREAPPRTPPRKSQSRS